MLCHEKSFLVAGEYPLALKSCEMHSVKLAVGADHEVFQCAEHVAYQFPALEAGRSDNIGEAQALVCLATYWLP